MYEKDTSGTGEKSKQTEEIKFNSSKDTTISYLFRKLADGDFSVYYLPFDKRLCSPNTQTTEQILIKKLLEDIIRDAAEPCEISIDNFLQGNAKKSFIAELQLIFKQTTIQMVNSSAYPEIQIADFIAGALHRYLCNPDDATAKRCYEIMKERCTIVNR